MGFTLNQLEQERQIRKLQKKEDKDTKDYDQLSNLPKINNVELKGDKTTSDLGINATNVMMSDGVTSVEDRIDAHNFSTDTRVSITDYTQQNPYECPCDGYVRLDIISGQKYMSINGVNMEGGTFSNATSFTFLVKKGMKLAPSAGNGTFDLYFFPFE